MVHGNAGSARRGSLGTIRWFHADQSHHSSVFVFQKMAMINKRADAIGVAKIHAQSDARILEGSTVIERHVDGVAQKRLVYR